MLIPRILIIMNLKQEFLRIRYFVGHVAELIWHFRRRPPVYSDVSVFALAELREPEED